MTQNNILGSVYFALKWKVKLETTQHFHIHRGQCVLKKWHLFKDRQIGGWGCILTCNAAVCVCLTTAPVKSFCVFEIMQLQHAACLSLLFPEKACYGAALVQENFTP